MGKVIKWTTDEDDFLKNHYESKGSVWVSNRVNRTPGATQKRAKTLGLNFCGVKIKYQKDNLTEIVKESKSISDVIIKLGLRNAGGNFKTIKNYIKIYNIDTDHFESEELRVVKFKELSKEKKVDLNLVLIENSTYSRSSLKKRLVEENILDYKCEKCFNIGEWLGEKITLQLDHKNGIFNDNRIENLRFLCPNCHSQTDTFAGKKMKKEKKQTTNLNLYISRRKVDRPPFNQLLNEVTEMGYSGTGRKYGVSDNTIRKWISSFEKYNAG
jgi:Zn finger protein HypA/HybF involved in hydrogenase expression